MTTDAISSSPTSAILPGASSGKGGMNQSTMDFYNLLTTQLTHQNPLEPVKETDFLGQMAQFSTVEQLQGLTQGMKQSQTEQRWLDAQSFIGREVQWSSETSGVENAGTVERIHRDADGAIWLQVEGRAVALERVHAVSPGGSGSQQNNDSE